MVMVKANTKLFLKDTIENLTKDCTGGSYLELKRKYTLTGDRLLISIGYKYNVQKVLYFITIEDVGSKKAGITYLYKYTEPFDNYSILTVARIILMYKLFGYVNGGNSHNKPRQSDLALEN